MQSISSVAVSLLPAEPLIMAHSGFDSGCPTPPPPPPTNCCTLPFASWEESLMMVAAGLGSGSGSTTLPPPPPPTHSCIPPPLSSWEESTMMQALDLVRESTAAGTEPTICNILENALERVWTRVLAFPDEYIMNKNEFSLFNYFQARFKGNEVAMAARRRYWDNAHG